MMNLVINLAIIGAFCFVYIIAVYVAHKWLARPQRLPMYIIIPILALVLLTSCGGDGDHTGENWLLLIGLLLCWLKG